MTMPGPLCKNYEEFHTGNSTKPSVECEAQSEAPLRAGVCNDTERMPLQPALPGIVPLMGK